ncbi:MAG: hypothetical protein ABI861_09285 [Panacibacter sp.]
MLVYLYGSCYSIMDIVARPRQIHYNILNSSGISSNIFGIYLLQKSGIVQNGVHFLFRVFVDIIVCGISKYGYLIMIWRITVPFSRVPANT